MGTITLAGVDIDLWESGEGPPLLYLHGAGGFRGDHPFVEPIGRHRRIIAPSHPGFGKSALPDWIDRPDDIAHLYLELLDRLGLDAGRPDRLLASAAGSPPRWRPRSPDRISQAGPGRSRRRQDRHADKLDIPDVFALPRRRGQEAAVSRPGNGTRRLRRRCRTTSSPSCCATGKPCALLAWEPYMHNPKLQAPAAPRNVPTLFVRGETRRHRHADYVRGYCQADARTRGCTTIPQAGHLPQIEQPQAFHRRGRCSSCNDRGGGRSNASLALQRNCLPDLPPPDETYKIDPRLAAEPATTTRRSAPTSTTAISTNGCIAEDEGLDIMLNEHHQTATCVDPCRAAACWRSWRGRRRRRGC